AFRAQDRARELRQRRDGESRPDRSRRSDPGLQRAARAARRAADRYRGRALGERADLQRGRAADHGRRLRRAGGADGRVRPDQGPAAAAAVGAARRRREHGGGRGPRPGAPRQARARHGTIPRLRVRLPGRDSPRRLPAAGRAAADGRRRRLPEQRVGASVHEARAGDRRVAAALRAEGRARVLRRAAPARTGTDRAGGMSARYEQSDMAERNGPLDELVLAHAELVKRIAYHLLARLPAHIDVEDLIQAGMIGLIGAARHYSADKGANFETYAGIRIRGAMLDEVRKAATAPRSTLRRAKQVAAAISEVERREGRDA